MKKLITLILLLGLTGCVPSFLMPTLPPTVSPKSIITDTPAARPILPADTATPTPTPTDTPLPTATRVTPTITQTPTLIPQFQKPVATVALLPGVLTFDGASCLPRTTQEDLAIVVKVDSGDTIDVIVNGVKTTIGYLGIQAPTLPVNGKLGGFYAKNSLQKNTDVVSGQVITLVKDASDTDSRGRLLRYVIVNNRFINFDLVNQGFAISYWSSEDSACKLVFDAAQANARSSLTGLWAVTPTPMYVPSAH